MQRDFKRANIQLAKAEEWHKLEMKLSRKGFKYVFKC